MNDSSEQTRRVNAAVAADRGAPISYARPLSADEEKAYALELSEQAAAHAAAESQLRHLSAG